MINLLIGFSILLLICVGIVDNNKDKNIYIKNYDKNNKQNCEDNKTTYKINNRQ